jgi:hypothetical protein
MPTAACKSLRQKKAQNLYYPFRLSIFLLHAHPRSASLFHRSLLTSTAPFVLPLSLFLYRSLARPHRRLPPILAETPHSLSCSRPTRALPSSTPKCRRGSRCVAPVPLRTPGNRRLFVHFAFPCAACRHVCCCLGLRPLAASPCSVRWGCGRGDACSRVCDAGPRSGQEGKRAWMLTRRFRFLHPFFGRFDLPSRRLHAAVRRAASHDQRFAVSGRILPEPPDDDGLLTHVVVVWCLPRPGMFRPLACVCRCLALWLLHLLC